jgi:hypothetical protein
VKTAQEAASGQPILAHLRHDAPIEIGQLRAELLMP